MVEEGSLRERLIDAGVDLVLAEGSGSVGLREIARRAGVSHGAPRRYFPTHQALLSAIARRGFEDLAARFEAAATAATTPRARIRAIALAYVGYALERRGMFELMFRHDLLDGTGAATDADADRPRLREASLPHFAHLVDLVGRCRTGSTPPTVMAAALWSNLHGIAQLWTWGSLQLAVGADRLDQADQPDQPDRLDQLDRLDRLVTAALDAHLGPATS